MMIITIQWIRVKDHSVGPNARAREMSEQNISILKRRPKLFADCRRRCSIRAWFLIDRGQIHTQQTQPFRVPRGDTLQ